MRACWMFVILVGCRLTHATQSQSTCACNDQLKTVCVPAGGNVTVPCPKLTGDEVTFKLFQDEEMISNHTCNSGGNAPNCNPPYTRAGVELDGKTENKSVSFMLTGVNASSHGVYRCEAMVIFPPPLTTVASAWRILVAVEGHQCKKVCSHAKADGDQNSGFHWILIIVLVSIYSVAVTIIAIVFGVKLRKTDDQSDYMNTKPKPPRERRKKQWGQNPILPRHF